MHNRSTTLDVSALVPTVCGTTGFKFYNFFTSIWYVAVSVQNEGTSSGRESFTGGSECIWQAFQRRGLEDSAVKILMSSIAPSTRKQYQSSLRRWKQFCVDNQVSMHQASSTDVIKFLTERYSEGASYGTLCSDRSAIALISQHEIGKDNLICRFLRGVYKNKPSKPKYDTTWDVGPVLEYIENMSTAHELSLREITEKIVTLLALVTAHRLQTLALIRIKNIVVGTEGITIKIPDLIKTSKPGKSQPELSLPFFKEKPKLCAATAILEYIDFTKDLRQPSNKNLLIATRKPYNDASAQTIGHWIKNLLKKAGIDTEQFSAYSTRHAAVSAALNKGVDVATIRRTAGWTEQSQMFAKFSNKPIQGQTNNFVSTLLQKE